MGEDSLVFTRRAMLHWRLADCRFIFIVGGRTFRYIRRQRERVAGGKGLLQRFVQLFFEVHG